MDSPRIHPEGEPVFLEHGGNSDYLESINSILNVLYVGSRTTRPFFKTLEEMDLLESFVLDAQLSDGSEHRLAGFYTVNEDALAELEGEQLDMLNKRGYLEAVYMVIASMSNLPAMLEKKNEMRKAEAENAEG
jgi:hypothetical protein